MALTVRPSSEVPDPSSYRPFQSILDLVSVMGGARTLGLCRIHEERLKSRIRVKVVGAGSRCGLVWALTQNGKLLDALSYATLRLKGTASGDVTVALVDEAGRRREDHVAVAHVTGSFDLEIPLKSLARRLNLRQLSGVVLVANGEGEVLLEEASLQASAQEAARQAIGFWSWDYQAAIHDPKALIASCLRHGCRRLLLQMPALCEADSIWAAYAGLFPLLEAAHIELFALDGYPEAIQDPGPLADKVSRLLSLMDGQGLAGVQLDIEPYSLPGFFDDQTGFERYLAAIDRVKAALDGRGRLSVVMPFWFASTTFKDPPLPVRSWIEPMTSPS